MLLHLCLTWHPFHHLTAYTFILFTTAPAHVLGVYAPHTYDTLNNVNIFTAIFNKNFILIFLSLNLLNIRPPAVIGLEHPPNAFHFQNCTWLVLLCVHISVYLYVYVRSQNILKPVGLICSPLPRPGLVCCSLNFVLPEIICRLFA